MKIFFIKLPYTYRFLFQCTCIAYHLSFHTCSLSRSIPLLPVETGLLCSGFSNVRYTAPILHHNLLTLTKKMKYKYWIENRNNNGQNTFNNPQTLIFIRWWQEIVYTSLNIKGQTKINTLLSFIFQNALLISEVNDIHLRGTSISKQHLRLSIVRVKSILFTNNLTNYVQWVSESIIRYRPLRFTFTVAWRKPRHKFRVSRFFIQCSSSDHHKVFSFEKQSHMYKQIHNLNPVF